MYLPDVVNIIQSCLPAYSKLHNFKWVAAYDTLILIEIQVTKAPVCSFYSVTADVGYGNLISTELCLSSRCGTLVLEQTPHYGLCIVRLFINACIMHQSGSAVWELVWDWPFTVWNLKPRDVQLETANDYICSFEIKLLVYNLNENGVSEREYTYA